MTMLFHRFSPRGAFTILEVLVASAILGILVVILLGTLTTTLALWRNVDNKLTADREGRSAQLVLGQDLASVVMPTNPQLWPRKVTNEGIVFLQFLTLKPQDYQAANDVGDVCYVEYAVIPDRKQVVRNFFGSEQTFEDILKLGAFPSAPDISDAQLVADNLLVNNRDAARRMNLHAGANTNHFEILGTNALPVTGAYSPNNRPALIEFNFAAVDPQTAANSAIMGNPDIVLRSASLFSARFALPGPSQ